MAGTPGSIASLKKLIKQTPDLEQLDQLLDDLQLEQHGRAAALIAGAILDGALKQALFACFHPDIAKDPDFLFGYSGPLGSFSAKIRMGFALGIFDRSAFNDLDCIREIRNACAHTMFRIEFDMAEVKAVCERLKVVDRVLSEQLAADGKPSHRGTFTLAATLYSVALYHHSVGSDRNWGNVLHSDKADGRWAI